MEADTCQGHGVRMTHDVPVTPGLSLTLGSLKTEAPEVRPRLTSAHAGAGQQPSDPRLPSPAPRPSLIFCHHHPLAPELIHFHQNISIQYLMTNIAGS